MKSKFWRLLKLQMIDQSGFNRYRNEKDYKKKNKQLLYVLALGFVGVMMISYSSMLAGAMVAFHMGELIPMFSMTISSVVALVYTMTKANSTLFAKDDYEILMALPIPLRTMIATRFTSLYISNVAFSALVMVPMAVAYAVGVRPGAIYYILLIPGILLANVVPTLIATMIAALATLIASRFRKVKGMQAVLSILLIVGIFSISFLTSGKNTTEMQVKQIIKFISEKIRSFYPLAGMYQDGVIKGNIMALLLFVGISVALYVIFVVLLSIRYKQLVTILHTSRVKGNFKMRELSINSPTKALFIKERKRFFGTPVYVVNMGIGAVMAILLSVAIGIFGPEKLEKLTEFKGMAQVAGMVIPFVIGSMFTLSSTTCVSLSLEGKNLWILKSAPISMKDIVKSKILVNLVLLLPCAIIAGISLNIGTCQTMTQRIAAFLIPICFSFFVSCWGIFSNSKFLDFEWEDEVMIIKRGAAVMMGTFGGMMIAGGVALFAFLLTLVSYLLAVVASSILLIGLSYFYFRKVYNNPHLLDD